MEKKRKTTKREQRFRHEDREIITPSPEGTEIIRYNEHIKEIIQRDTEGKETVRYERMTEEERERLDELADTIEYYTDLNDRMEQEPSTDSLEGFDLADSPTNEERELDELDELRNRNEERDRENEREIEW